MVEVEVLRGRLRVEDEADALDVFFGGGEAAGGGEGFAELPS